MHAETELRTWHEKCDDVGVPHDPDGLIRHHRGNAALAAQFDLIAAQQQRDRAQGALRKLVALHDGPRDAEYHRRKPLAWQHARDLLDAPAQSTKSVLIEHRLERKPPGGGGGHTPGVGWMCTGCDWRFSYDEPETRARAVWLVDSRHSQIAEHDEVKGAGDDG